MHEICAAIASETAILDALGPHYDLQSVEREFEWAITTAYGSADPASVRWESVFAHPRRFPMDANRHPLSRDLQMYDSSVARRGQRNSAIATLFAAALIREYTPGRHDVSPQWIAVFMTHSRALGTPVVLAATQFIAWHFLATESTTERDPDLTLAIAIGLGHLTGRVARHFRDIPSDQRKFGFFDPAVEFPMWQAAIDDVLTFGNGVDESLWYAREALNLTERDTRR